MGGKTTVEQPTPPAAPTTAEAVDAYVANYPRMQELQMQYAPQLAQQQYDLQSQYAPQYAQQAWDLQSQYAPEYAAQQQALQQQYEPEAYAAKQQLGDLMQGGYLTNYDPGGYGGAYDTARSNLRQDYMDTWGYSGLGKSGMMPYDVSEKMSAFEFPYAQQQEQMRLGELGRRQNQAMALTGRATVPTVQNVSSPQVSTPNLMGGYDFGGVQQGMQQGYGTYGSMYGNMYNANAQMAMQPSPWASVLGQFAGSLGGGLGQGWGSQIAKSSKRYKTNIRPWKQ